MILVSSVFGQDATPVVQDKTGLINEINSRYPNNTTGLITPQVLREVTKDQVVSFQQTPRVNSRSVSEASYTFTQTDYGFLVVFNNAGPVAVSLPQAIGPFATWNVYTCNNGAGTVTITPSVSQIGNAASLQLLQGQCRNIVSDGTNYQFFGGGGPTGGALPKTCSASQWINELTTAGTFTCAQPTFTDISGTLAANKGGTGSTTVPTTGQLLIGNAGGTAYAPQTLTGDVTVTSAGISKVAKVNGVTYPAGPIAAGTVPVVQNDGVTVVYQIVGGGAAFSTGDAKLTLKTAPDPGWIIMNDGTIGNAASGATTRANADTQALFVLLWTNIANADAPVSGGRGANALADYNANKTITLTRQLGRSIAVAGAGAGLTSRVLGHFDGNETHTQTLAELVSHAHAATSSFFALTSGVNEIGPGAGFFGVDNFASTTASTGTSSPMDIMNPRAYWNVMIKL